MNGMPHMTAPRGSDDSRTASARGRRRQLLYFGAIAPVALALIAGAVLLASGSSADIAAPGQPAPAMTVTATKPRHVTWPAVLNASGSVTAWEEASIDTQIGSYQLTEVLVNVGDQVRMGQVLARLDPSLLNAEEAQLQANYENIDGNRQRALALKSNGHISEQGLSQIVSQAKVAAAQLEAKRLQLRYTQITAPDDGVISARTATLGAVVPPGQELFRLIRQNRLEWRGELTPAQLAEISPGQRVLLTLPDGTTATAIVRQTAPMLDAQSRLGLVYADIEAGSHARAGMYLSGRVTLSESAVLAVPAASVVVRDGRSIVLKLADASATPKLSQQVVTVGRRRGDEVEVVSGLVDADRIVTEGAAFLNDGDVVRLAGRVSSKHQP